MCRCAQRREALARTVTEVAQGNLAAAAAETGYVIRTAVQDVAAVARRAAAHARLKR